MKIAILGWGSLIWQPKELKYDIDLGWNNEGVYLPIEFSRISNDGRLTLVIDSNATKVQTLYAVSLYDKLDEAISDLAEREGCFKDKIGWYDRSKDRFHPNNFIYKQDIKTWINDTDVDIVIWTNISRKFKDKIGLDHNSENVIEYLRTLSNDIKTNAEEYIRNAPFQINTVLRKEIEDKLGWTMISKI